MKSVVFYAMTVLGLLISCANANLRLNFYEKSCPNAEQIISEFVGAHITSVPSLAAALLRMHFHDCFVRGCDASVLIDSTSTNQAEKSALPNRTIRGFDFIDRIKGLVEEECPGVVSCADVLALSARDAVGAIGGPYWRVPTGRRDGLISNASEATIEIPAPTFNLSSLQESFASKGLNLAELVVLSGAHTIGVAHCPSFSSRLYNFTGKEDQDPSLDSLYAANLKENKCSSPDDTTTIVEMDPGSFRTFDLGYYQNLLKRRGLFHSDAALVTDPATRSVVMKLADSPVELFLEQFALAMEKVGRIEVKAEYEGEIRKQCRAVNNS